MKMHDTFLSVGPDHPPRVTLLSATQHAALLDGLRIAETRTKDPVDARQRVYAATFGEGALWAFPLWSEPMLGWLVDHYDGPHKERVRTIAAASLIGEPYSESGPDRPDGGTPAELIPVPPVRPPQGSAADLVFARS